MTAHAHDLGEDDYGEPPFICPKSKEPCIRAFCEDYGCADKARVPVDTYDVARGSTHIDDLIPRIPRFKRKAKRPTSPPQGG